MVVHPFNQMRSRAHGYPYSPLPTDVAGGIENENDEMTESLKDKIRNLKTVSIEIGNEVKNQNRLLRNIDDDFEKTGGFLGHTMSRVLRLSKGRHNYYICYLMLFACVVFFILYIVIKLK